MGRAYARVLPDPVGALMQTSCSALRPPAVMRQAAAWTGYSSAKPSARECSVSGGPAAHGMLAQSAMTQPVHFSDKQLCLGRILWWPAD